MKTSVHMTDVGSDLAHCHQMIDKSSWFFNKFWMPFIWGALEADGTMSINQ
jgi:hypothetical protein